MNANAYDETYNYLFEDPRDAPPITTTAPKTSAHSMLARSSKIQYIQPQPQTTTAQASKMAEPVKPIVANANFMTTISATPTPYFQPMNPVFITPSPSSSSLSATATSFVNDTPDNSSDDTATIITGVAFAALIFFIAIVLIIKRRRQKIHDPEKCIDEYMDEDSHSINSKTRLRPNQPSYIPYKQPPSEVSSIILSDSPRSSVLDTQGERKRTLDPIPSPTRISFPRVNQDIARFSLKKTDSWGNYVKQVLHKPTMNEATEVPQQTTMSASAYGVCELTIGPPETGRCRTESTITPVIQRPEAIKEWSGGSQSSNAHAYTLSTAFPQQEIIESYHPLVTTNTMYNSVSPAPRQYLPTVNCGQQQAVRINLADPASHQAAYKSDGHPSF